MNGNILVVDKLDAKMHPLISLEIISLFNDPKRNPHGAQLIFTTHDTNLLSSKQAAVIKSGLRRKMNRNVLTCTT